MSFVTDNDGYEEWEKASVASESQGNGVSWVIEKSEKKAVSL